MTIQFSQSMATSPVWMPPSFRAWQKHVYGLGLLPVIGVAGDRGKSTVVRLLDAIFQRAGLRSATWTDLGVEIRKRRQRGEISGWSLALNRLAESSIDVAIQELHWSLINTVGLPASSYPLVGITNLFDSHDGPMLDTHEAAIRGTMRTLAAVHQQGMLTISGDEFALIDAAADSPCDVIVTSLSPDSPGLKHHLGQGGSGIWLDTAEIVEGTADRLSPIHPLSAMPFTLFGASPFLTSSAMTAMGLAMSVGIDPLTISGTLREFSITDHELPGSFNTYAIGGYTVIVDRVSTPGHLRQLIRTVNPGHQRRQITVIGNLDGFHLSRVADVGRVLGRQSGAIILHSDPSPNRVEAFRRGITANEYPPLFAYLPTERRAINRAIKSAHPEDIVLILTGEDPSPVIRAIRRQLES
jgi:UDP-N-acetylmuramyl tripeptide synthase